MVDRQEGGERSMSGRRRGSEDSRSRIELVEAATRLLARDGVGAITARRVAQEVGLSHQIVHYYFRSMDDLLVAIIEHGMVHTLEQLDRAQVSDDPLKAVVELNSTLNIVVMSTELLIHAASRPVVEDAIRSAIDAFRQAQVAALTRHVETRKAGLGWDDTIPPLVATVLMTSVLRNFALEKGVGFALGHQETMRWLASALSAPDLTGEEPVL